jgi:UV DNA damage endonuclease
MIMLENDDTVFTVRDTLYLCEKLGIPFVFDLHHHFANREEGEDWKKEWNRIVNTWKYSPLPIKMHISSPKSDKEFRAHHDFVDVQLFFFFA